LTRTFLAIEVRAGTTKIGVSQKSMNDALTTKSQARESLPLNCATRVRVEAVGSDVAIFYNDTIAGFRTFGRERYSGEMKVEAPILASASISFIQLASISKISLLSNLSISEYSGPIAPGTVIEKTFVPADYALSFSITPHNSGHDDNAGPGIIQYQMGKGAAIQGSFIRLLIIPTVW
jgi:hypothetical protein